MEYFIVCLWFGNKVQYSCTLARWVSITRYVGNLKPGINKLVILALEIKSTVDRKSPASLENSSSDVLSTLRKITSVDLDLHSDSHESIDPQQESFADADKMALCFSFAFNKLTLFKVSKNL